MQGYYIFVNRSRLNTHHLYYVMCCGLFVVRQYRSPKTESMCLEKEHTIILLVSYAAVGYGIVTPLNLFKLCMQLCN
jgi:hypothetical protein